jgi:hypothetical protein
MLAGWTGTYCRCTQGESGECEVREVKQSVRTALQPGAGEHQQLWSQENKFVRCFRTRG